MCTWTRSKFRERERERERNLTFHLRARLSRVQWRRRSLDSSHFAMKRRPREAPESLLWGRRSDRGGSDVSGEGEDPGALAVMAVWRGRRSWLVVARCELDDDDKKGRGRGEDVEYAASKTAGCLQDAGHAPPPLQRRLRACASMATPCSGSWSSAKPPARWRRRRTGGGGAWRREWRSKRREGIGGGVEKRALAGRVCERAGTHALYTTDAKWRLCP